MSEIKIDVTADPAIGHEEFKAASETVGTGNIFVIKPDEYPLLASLTDEEARDLPDGMYVVDATVRERFAAMGITYEDLSRAVMDGFSLISSEGDEDQRRLRLGRSTSAHKVFFGSARFDGARSELGDNVTMIAIKPHIERGELSAKPFHEVGNLALMQSVDRQGVYKPIGLIQDGPVKYVLTELRPGVRTLDEHPWSRKEPKQPSPQRGISIERMNNLERDAALIKKVFVLFAELHANGVFHGDSQAKNIGWNMANINVENATGQTEMKRSDDLSLVQFTVVDMENTKIFFREAGDLPDDYYDQLTALAVRDIGIFYQSIPKFAREYARIKTDEETKMPVIVEEYIKAFAAAREAACLSPLGEAVMEKLSQAINQEIIRFDTQPKPAKMSHRVHDS